MAGKVLLDTNIVVALFKGDPAVTARLLLASEVFLSSVVLGELYFGAAHSSRPSANASRIDDFSSTCTVVKVDSDTARRYGEIKNELKSKGRPIPENDVWIAACALQHGFVLATRDRHFDSLENLDVQAW